MSGKQLPADHGYLLYSAIARATGSAGVLTGGADVPAGSAEVPAGSAGILPVRSRLHKTDWLAIELISGFPSGRGLITLPERGATLRLRIPADHYRDVLPLAGKRLDIGGHQIRLGLPAARPLEPASSLYARVVTIKKFTEPEPFLEAVKRKLDQFGISGRVELPFDGPQADNDVAQTVSLRPDGDSKLKTKNSKLNFRYRRRIVTIHGKSVVGFSVAARLVMSSVQRLSAIIEFRISYLPKQHSHCSTPYTAQSKYR
ncbi:MAG: type I-MYXAN CRISPR-associated protein Cas6/Cmx6 [Acidobacteriota bacterium]|nr:type I-MYXAN CRISPR-associated protein Cas6/Cmx6 [Acidobacteriota bacterium]